jgi:uncharacterized protein (TIGR00106 family)
MQLAMPGRPFKNSHTEIKEEDTMSVVIQFSIFPMDKGARVSPYVARAARIIRDSGFRHEIGPMGTCIEGEWEEVIGVVTRCFEDLKKDCDRVYLTIGADYRKDSDGRIQSKVKSVERKLRQEED